VRFHDADVAERCVAIGPEAMKRVWRHGNHVSRSRDDLHTVERVDASSLIDDKYLPMRMAMLLRASARRVGAHSDHYGKAPFIKTNDPVRHTQELSRRVASPMP
jgi:hypothetical protein